MKVMLLGNLEDEEEEEEKRGGADRGPRLTLKDRGRGRDFPSSSLLLPLSFTTRSCDRKCLMFCLAAWTSFSSSSTPRMWAGLNFRATARVM